MLSISSAILSGIRAVNPRQAEIVLRIYRAYADGEAPRSIARGLNPRASPVRQVEPGAHPLLKGMPAAGPVSSTTNSTSEARLEPPQVLKNPNTGKRQSRLNSHEAWIVKDVPELRIVPQELWDAVKARQAQMARATRPDRKKADFWKAPTPSLSGCPAS